MAAGRARAPPRPPADPHHGPAVVHWRPGCGCRTEWQASRPTQLLGELPAAFRIQERRERPKVRAEPASGHPGLVHVLGNRPPAAPRIVDQQLLDGLADRPAHHTGGRGGPAAGLDADLGRSARPRAQRADQLGDRLPARTSIATMDPADGPAITSAESGCQPVAFSKAPSTPAWKACPRSSRRCPPRPWACPSGPSRPAPVCARMHSWAPTARPARCPRTRTGEGRPSLGQSKSGLGPQGGSPRSAIRHSLTRILMMLAVGIAISAPMIPNRRLPIRKARKTIRGGSWSLRP
jgi:hypothetical protein